MGFTWVMDYGSGSLEAVCSHPPTTNRPLRFFASVLATRKSLNPQLTRQAIEKPPRTSSALFTGTRNSRVEPQCCYCQQSHPSTSCTSVTNPADCKQSLKTSGRALTAYVAAMFRETVNHPPDARSATRSTTPVSAMLVRKKPQLLTLQPSLP